MRERATEKSEEEILEEIRLKVAQMSDIELNVECERLVDEMDDVKRLGTPTEKRKKLPFLQKLFDIHRNAKKE